MLNFDGRRKQRDVSRLVGRIIDRSTIRQHSTDNDRRSANRYTRRIPLLVGPWNDGKPAKGEFALGITKDLSGEGVSVVLSHKWASVDVLCGFYNDGASFLRGELRHKSHLGGNFWQLGVRFVEVIDPGRISNFGDLQKCVEALNPRSVQAFV